MRILLVLVLAAVLVAPAGARLGPRLSVDRTDVFTVRGAGFKPSERVRVRVTVQQLTSKVVVAGRKGGFLVRFPTVKIVNCEGYLVRANGTKGSRATLLVKPTCAQP
jgi:hypothetical protein